MVWYAENNNLLKPDGGNSGAIPFCVPTPPAFFIGDIMREIPLTQGKIALVDDEDYDRLTERSWCAQPSLNTFYAIRCIKVNKKNITIRMHREVLNLGINDKISVDHRDRNGLHNFKSNLRKCTHSQNMQNQRIRKGNKTSKYRGVWLSKCNRKNKIYKYWYAGIRFEYKMIHLGSFKYQIDAARAYDEAAKKYFGEFANTNF